MMKKVFAILMVLTSTMAFAQADKDILTIAREAGSFNTLVAAVEAAGLDGVLSGEGHYTVFAPTDEAFAKLPTGTVESLLGDIPTLTNILLYHVVPGNVLAEEVLKSSRLLSAAGPSIVVSSTEGPMVQDASIVATDIVASNGVIHVIDSVILPPSDSIVDIAVGAGSFNTLVAALQATGLDAALTGDGPFTVFAPTDDTFAQLPEGTLEYLLANPAELADILLYHVVPARVFSENVIQTSREKSLQGSYVHFSKRDGVMVDNANIVAVDIEGSNGVIHVIDSVILPQQKVGQEFEITITNLTRGQSFAPPVLLAHGSDVELFSLGNPASGSLKTLAETGDGGPAIDEFKSLNSVYDFYQASEMIGPGESLTLTYKGANAFSQVTVAGMLTGTNDAFFWSQVTSPRLGGFAKGSSYRQITELAWAYDAGTEANTESCNDVPGAGCEGAASVGAGEGFVYFAPGISGIGDLEPELFDWRGPVAKIEVRLK